MLLSKRKKMLNCQKMLKQKLRMKPKKGRLNCKKLPSVKLMNSPPMTFWTKSSKWKRSHSTMKTMNWQNLRPMNKKQKLQTRFLKLILKLLSRIAILMLMLPELRRKILLNVKDSKLKNLKDWRLKKLRNVNDWKLMNAKDWKFRMLKNVNDWSLRRLRNVRHRKMPIERLKRRLIGKQENKLTERMLNLRHKKLRKQKPQNVQSDKLGRKKNLKLLRKLPMHCVVKPQLGKRRNQLTNQP